MTNTKKIEVKVGEGDVTATAEYAGRQYPLEVKFTGMDGIKLTDYQTANADISWLNHDKGEPVKVGFRSVDALRKFLKKTEEKCHFTPPTQIIIDTAQQAMQSKSLAV